MNLGDSWIVNLLVAAGTLLGILYFYLAYTYDYWKKRGVPYVKPTLFFGNIKDLLMIKKPLAMILSDIYKELKGHRFGGYFELRTPVLMILDPKLIERIFIKDFSFFQIRDFYQGLDLESNPLFRNLALLPCGQEWQDLRHKITPMCTTSKLKSIMEQIINCSSGILEEVEKSSDSGKAVDLKALVSLFSLDLSASILCGVQCKPQAPERVEFDRFIKTSPPLMQRVRGLLMIFCGKLTKLLKMRYYPKEVTDYYINMVKKAMDTRKRNNVQQNDFLQLLMNLKDEEDSGKQINWKSDFCEEDAYLVQMDYSTKDSKLVFTDECIAAQLFMFVAAGSEALATTLQSSLFELAANTHVQARLQQEIDSILAKHNGQLTYEGLKQMHYLDLFIQERNRKYASLLHRICTENYLIPGTDVVIEKGTRVFIPLNAIHHDPDYYHEPDKFIPERFEGNNYRSSGTYLPFGDGPRMCIAMRLSILLLKASITKIMSRYSVTLNPRTKVPLEFDPKSLVFFKPKGGIWVNFKRRKTKTDSS